MSGAAARAGQCRPTSPSRGNKSGMRLSRSGALIRVLCYGDSIRFLPRAKEGMECAKSPSQQQGHSYWLARWLGPRKPLRSGPCCPRQCITRRSRRSPAAVQAHVAHGGGPGCAVPIAVAARRAAGIGAPGVTSRSPQHQGEAASIGGLRSASPSVPIRDMTFRNRIAGLNARQAVQGKSVSSLSRPAPFGPTKMRSKPSHSVTTRR